MINDHPGNMNCRALEHSWIVPGTAGFILVASCQDTVLRQFQGN